MAKKTETPRPDGGRTFKPDSAQFTSLVIGEEIDGTFINASFQTITDKRTRAEKQLWVLRLRDIDNPEKTYKLPCAAMMLQAWNDIVDEYGEGDTDEAIRTLRGKRVVIVRAEDVRTKGGNVMGSYEITVFD